MVDKALQASACLVGNKNILLSRNYVSKMAGKAFLASPVHAQPVIYVSAKRPMANFLSNRVGKVALRWLCRLKWLIKFCMACVQLNTITKLEGFSMMIRNLFVCMSVCLYVRPSTVQAIN